MADIIDQANQAMVDDLSDKIRRVQSSFNQEASDTEYCENCGEDIPAERRRLVPCTTLCVRCQANHERYSKSL